MYATTAEQRRAAETRELAATLYVEHYHGLRGIAQSNCGRWAEAEDAVQEAFAIFLAEYDPEAGSPPERWLGLTLKRLCWATIARRHMAARMGIAGIGFDADGPPFAQAVSDADTATEVERSERVRRTRAGLRTLPSQQRRALSLLALGYSYSEIAERLGLSKKQVDHRLQGAREALRAR
jgi:RNA polymerase sigma factor (sigma-70 family)